MSVTTGGGFDVADATELELSGAVTGAGTLTKLGTGALVLSSHSAVDWDIQAGSLSAQAANFTGDAAIGAGETFLLNADLAATYAGTLSGTGTFTKTGAAALTYTGDGSDFTGETSIASGLLP